MRELYFECCLSQGVLMHTFVGLNLQIVVASHMGIMQWKLLKRTNREILKTVCVGGLIRASAASSNTRGCFMLNGFMLLFLIFTVSLLQLGKVLS